MSITGRDYNSRYYYLLEARKGCNVDVEAINRDAEWKTDEYKEFLNYLSYAIDFSQIFHVVTAQKVLVDNEEEEDDENSEGEQIYTEPDDEHFTQEEESLETESLGSGKIQSHEVTYGWKSSNKTNNGKGSASSSTSSMATLRVVAFILAKVENNIFAFTKKNRTISGHITNLVVLDSFRRKGIAKTLMLQIQERLRSKFKTQFISLNVREKNTSAIQLYQSLHYTMVSKLPKYYKNGDNAIRMEMHFEQEALGTR